MFRGDRGILRDVRGVAGALVNGVLMIVGARVLALAPEVEETIREDLRAWFKLVADRTVLVVGDCEDGPDKWALEEWPKGRPFALWYRTGSYTVQSSDVSEITTRVWWTNLGRPSVKHRSEAMAAWAGRFARAKEIQGLCVGYRASWSSTNGTVDTMKAAVAGGLSVIDRYYQKEL